MENACMEKNLEYLDSLFRWKMTGKCPWKKRPWKKPGVFGLLVQVENDWKMSMNEVSMEKTWSIWTPCPWNCMDKCPWNSMDKCPWKSIELHGNLSMELDKIFMDSPWNWSGNQNIINLFSGKLPYLNYSNTTSKDHTNLL
jgi:hypothetical protein